MYATHDSLRCVVIKKMSSSRMPLLFIVVMALCGIKAKEFQDLSQRTGRDQPYFQLSGFRTSTC